MASKFWGGSSSESESESDVESSSSGSVAGDFFASSSSDDDEGRVIKSQKEKRWDQLKATCVDIKEKAEDADWNETVKAFELLTKQIQKSKTVIDKEGTPPFIIRILARLEDFVEEALADKEGRKKLSPTNSKSLNAIKQRLRKHNKAYEEKIAAFRENWVTTEDEEEAEAAAEEDDSDSDDWDPDADSDDEAPKKKKKGKAEEPAKVEEVVYSRELIKQKVSELLANRGKKGTDREGLVDELKHLVSVSTDPRTEIETMVVLISVQFEVRSTAAQNHIGVDEWLSVYRNLVKVLTLVEASEGKLTVKENIAVDVLPEPKKGPGAVVEEEEKEDESVVAIPGSLGAFTERLDDEFIKSLQFIDPHTQEYVQRLQDENKVLLLTVRVEEYYRRLGNAEMVNLMALRRIERLYYKRENLNPLKVLHKSMPDLSTADGAAAQAPEAQASAVPPPATPRGTTDFSKATPVSALKKTFEGDAPSTAAVPDEPTLEVLGKQGVSELSMSISDVIYKLAVDIYAANDQRATTRAMLCQIYNLALEEKFHMARDMLLMSHLQSEIGLADIATQILYNRAMVQLGLCAFRHGFIYEAHASLADLYGSGRVKELMAQGVTTMRYGEKNPEQEKQAKLRQMPYHMHINLELIDSVHLVCAMLLEVPTMAQNALDTKRRMISRPFRRLMDQLDRQVFNGPPENAHDFIMGATRALMEGKVNECWTMLLELKMWTMLPNPEPVKKMLESKIREEGLRTYLFKHSHMYVSISLDMLVRMFSMEEDKVFSMVSSMMMNEELHGRWDGPSKSIMMHRTEPSKLQFLAMQFADKAVTLIENNEKLSDQVTGSSNYSWDRNRGGDWDGHRRGNRGNQGGGRRHYRQNY